MKPSTNSGSPSAALLLLQIAAITSSSSSLAAAGVTCADSSSLQLNECLTPGNAICSPSEGWAFGIDATDQRIKLWEGDRTRKTVLFAGSVNAEAICVGGKSGQYGPHEYAAGKIPSLFVSFDGGNYEAFLQCKNRNSLLGAAVARGKAQLEIEDATSKTTIGTANAPVVSFQHNSNVLWSIDASGSIKTNSECDWYSDAVKSPGVLKQDTDEDDDVEQVGERTRKHMLHPLPSRSCPCWEVDELNTVTAENQENRHSCIIDNDGHPYGAVITIIQNTDGDFQEGDYMYSIKAAAGGYVTIDNSTDTLPSEKYCGKREFAGNPLKISDRQHLACTQQIAARCNDIGTPLRPIRVDVPVDLPVDRPSVSAVT